MQCTQAACMLPHLGSALTDWKKPERQNPFPPAKGQTYGVWPRPSAENPSFVQVQYFGARISCLSCRLSSGVVVFDDETVHMWSPAEFAPLTSICQRTTSVSS